MSPVESRWTCSAAGSRRSDLDRACAETTEPDVALQPSDVGAWLFTREPANGSVVEEIELDDETGLFPAGYDRVGEALYNEGARIFNQIQRSKGE